MVPEHFFSESIEDIGLEDLEDRGSKGKALEDRSFPLPKYSPTGPARKTKVLAELTSRHRNPNPRTGPTPLFLTTVTHFTDRGATERLIATPK